MDNRNNRKWCHNYASECLRTYSVSVVLFSFSLNIISLSWFKFCVESMQVCIVRMQKSFFVIVLSINIVINEGAYYVYD